MASPSTMPGNTIGSEAKLSSSQRPGSRVFTTIQQITAVTSMMMVALATASRRLFHTARSRFGYAMMVRYGSSVRRESASIDGTA